MRNPYIKFQNPSMHSSRLMLCIKKCAIVKMPKVIEGHNSWSNFQNLFKSSSGHLLINTNLFTRFQGSSFNSFWAILLTLFIYIFSKGHNSGKGHNPDGKKTRVCYFFMKNPYMKFQNSSMHGSEVMLCIKKRNGRLHGRTDGRTDARMHKRPRSNMPLQLLRSWGHKELKCNGDNFEVTMYQSTTCCRHIQWWLDN